MFMKVNANFKSSRQFRLCLFLRSDNISMTLTMKTLKEFFKKQSTKPLVSFTVIVFRQSCFCCIICKKFNLIYFVIVIIVI